MERQNKQRYKRYARVSDHKKAVLMFDHSSKLACRVHECHHDMDFEDVEVVGHEVHYHQRLFLEAWMSVKDPNAGNGHMVIPEVYLTIRPVARKGYGSIAHKAKPTSPLVA